MMQEPERLRGMLPPPKPDRTVQLELELTRTGLQRLDTTILEALRAYLSGHRID